MSRMIFNKFDKIHCIVESTSNENVVESRALSYGSMIVQSAPPRNESF